MSFAWFVLVKLLSMILYFRLSYEFFRIVLNDFKSESILWWWSVTGSIDFSFRYSLSRSFIEFRIPVVIHGESLCSCFLILTNLGARCLALAFRMISSNYLWFSFGSQNKSGFMLEFGRRECTSSWKALNESSSVRLIWTNLGLCLTVFNISKTDI